MRIGNYQIDDGALALFGFLALGSVLVIVTLIKNAGDLQEQRKIAIRQGWTWIDQVPHELTEALGRLGKYQQNWQASNIMMASGLDGNGYLFHLKRSSISGFNETSKGQVDAYACLIPGPTKPNTTIYRIDRMPLKAIKSVVEIATITIDGLGSKEFQRQFMVSLEGLEYEEQAAYDNMGGDEAVIQHLVSQIKISAELEQALQQWFRPIGRPVAWSDIYLRDGLVMIIKSKTSSVLTQKEWGDLLAMCQSLSHALR